MGIWYATREQLKSALDSRETARNNAQVDRALESASRAVETEFHRRFYPEIAIRTFDWPNRQYARPWRLWLDQHELTAVTELVAGGVTIGPGEFLLRPDHGPPFTHVEINLGSGAALAAGDTHQRAIAITGTFGYPGIEAPAGQLTGAVDAVATTVDVTDSATADIGALLRAETERMVVAGRRMLDTGQTLGADLPAQANTVTVPVQNGDAYQLGETLQLDGEKMLVVEIAGDTLTVVRSWDGSPLAAHTTGAVVFAPRRLTVQRGVLGTTAAAHADATALGRHQPPGPITTYTRALGINQILQETAGYARTVGSAENEREAAGRGLRSARAEAWTGYARKSRKRAV
ncbi:MAG: hypothetical protein ACRDT2_11070 [Natronosporangium sp.]